MNKPIATVINNNQPEWTFIAETEPNVTLDVGTKLYAAAPATEPSEVERLAVEIADQAAIQTVKARKVGAWTHDDDCCLEIAYLDLRGLLEHHPEHPELVRVKGEKS